MNTQRLVLLGISASVILSASVVTADARPRRAESRIVRHARSSTDGTSARANRFTTTNRFATNRSATNRFATNRFATNRFGTNRFGTDRNRFGTDRNRFGTDRNRFGTDRNRFGANHWNGDRRWRNRHHSGSSFVFVGSFGFPFYPYSYYGYPYSYYGYPYSYGYPYYSSYSYGYPYYNSYAYDSYPYESGYYSYNQPRYRGNAYGGGSMVTEVQRRLAREGYYQGSIDGIMGPRTHYAIRAYQRAHDLEVDGAISDQLLSTMGLR